VREDLTSTSKHKEEMMRHFTVAIALLITLGLLVPNHAFAQEDSARVRVAHTSQDAPAIDLYIDGQESAQGISFFDVSEYTTTSVGKHRVQITPSGEPVTNAVLETNIDLGRDDYTIVVSGKGGSLQALLLEDSDLQPAAGKALIRFVHAAPDIAPVDFKLANSDIPFLTDQYYTSADYVEIDAGTLTFEVAPAGSENVFLITPEMRFESGWVYTVYLTGVVTGEPQAWLQVSLDQHASLE
jgi:hypothetical protein